ncbi:MAG: LPS export ABC transporter periplasmic protein LptC [Alphaproteobacteria bacterium]
MKDKKKPKIETDHSRIHHQYAQESKAVLHLKIILIFVAFFWVAVTFLWPYLKGDDTHFRLDDAPSEAVEAEEKRKGSVFEVIKIRYIGTDTNGNPFRLIADSAKQIASDEEGNAKIIYLNTPVVYLVQEDGKKATFSSKIGIYDIKENKIFLEGNVSLVDETGKKAYSDNIEVDLARASVKENKRGASKTAEAWTAKAKGHVLIRTGTETVRGDKAFFDQTRDTLLLKGDVKLKQGQSVLKGDELEMNLKTKATEFTGGKKAKEKGRVSGVFVPKTKKEKEIKTLDNIDNSLEKRDTRSVQ